MCSTCLRQRPWLTYQVVLSIAGYVVELQSGASDIVLSGLSVANGKWNLIQGTGLSNVTIKDSKIYNGGNTGIAISDSSVILVTNNVVNNLGCGGILLDGGDRNMLQHGNLRAVGNEVSG